ncbi:hypothetical protein LINPERPRIM_LOCUS37817 [Linum perenne]
MISSLLVDFWIDLGTSLEVPLLPELVCGYVFDGKNLCILKSTRKPSNRPITGQSNQNGMN